MDPNPYASPQSQSHRKALRREIDWVATLRNVFKVRNALRLVSLFLSSMALGVIILLVAGVLIRVLIALLSLL